MNPSTTKTPFTPCYWLFQAQIHLKGALQAVQDPGEKNVILKAVQAVAEAEGYLRCGGVDRTARRAFRKTRSSNQHQFYRNTDTLGCIQRIKKATAKDVEQLHAALLKEKLTKRPRRKLCRFLGATINQLDQDRI